MTERLFIALSIDDTVKKAILNSLSLPHNFRLTRPENMHITLLFLGDTDTDRILQLINIIEKTKLPPFWELEISRYGQFPPQGFPKIVYITGEKGKKELLSLASQIRSLFKPLGFEDNKDFQYHITVARSKFNDGKKWLLPVLKESYKFIIKELILYKSDLQPDGPVYKALYKKVLT